jgi:Protein of unknown function (DUF1569)
MTGDRRAFLAVASATALALPGCGAAGAPPFGSLAAARDALGSLGPLQGTGVWSVPQVLTHLAQSIEYSLLGFPQLKPAWFRATLGRAAFAVFDARGAMSHPLDQPIPGAPSLAEAQDIERARTRLIVALDQFERHTGRLQPHFAYGELDKAAYARAHLLHLCQHWGEFQPTAVA